MWQHASTLVVTATAEPTDQHLLRQIALRDGRALAAFYDRHSRLAFSVALRIMRASADAEEVLQETFVKVWSRAETYEPHLGSPAAWLARIARNCAIDRVRARRARQLVDAPPPEDDEAPRSEPVTAVTPEVVLEDTTKAGVVRGALSTLPPNQRRLIEAAFFEGYTHQELSQRFGVPLGTVKARIRTGLLALRTQLTHAL